MQFRKDKYPLFVLVLIHALWFIAATFIWQRPYSYDSVEYIQLAVNLKNGLYYSGNAALPVTEQFITLRPPVYALFIWLCWTIFGYNTWCILLVQNIISITSCFLIRNIFQSNFPKTGWQGIYWLLIVVYPMQMVFANMIFSDILLQFFLVLYLQQLFFFIKNRKPSSLFLMALWLTMGVFTKPVLYPFLFLQALWILIYCIKTKKAALISTAALPILLVVCYGLWNKKQTGVFHISSVEAYNLLEYNVREFYLFKYGKEETAVRMEQIHRRLNDANTFKERYDLSKEIALQKIKEDLPGYIAFHGLKSIQLFFDPNKLEFDIFSRHFSYVNNAGGSFYTSWRTQGISGVWNYLKDYPFLLILVITPVFGFFRLLGCILFLFEKGNDKYLRIAVVVFVLYFAIITGPVANARYFLPILLITSAGAWTGYANAIDRWKARKAKANE